jgi:hypothetical protein
VGLSFRQGLLEEAAISDRPGAAAIATPLGGKGLDPPTQLMGSTADGLIGATGTAMEQQMNGPAAAALQEGGGDALLGPGEITATGGNDDDGAMNNKRRRQQAS